MRPFRNALLTALALFASAGLWAQGEMASPQSVLMARLSYKSSSLIQEDDRQICLAIFSDGGYRVLLMTNKGGIQRLEGKVPDEQFKQLKTFLAEPEFQILTGNHGGLIRQESKSFGAEILREDSTQRLQWLNPDGENSFPKSVAKVVDWLKHFEPTNGNPFAYAEFPQVCPSVGVRLLQPSVSANASPSR